MNITFIQIKDIK